MLFSDFSSFFRILFFFWDERNNLAIRATAHIPIRIRQIQTLVTRHTWGWHRRRWCRKQYLRNAIDSNQLFKENFQTYEIKCVHSHGPSLFRQHTLAVSNWQDSFLLWMGEMEACYGYIRFESEIDNFSFEFSCKRISFDDEYTHYTESSWISICAQANNHAEIVVNLFCANKNRGDGWKVRAIDA